MRRATIAAMAAVAAIAPAPRLSRCIGWGRRRG
jgi:hypothetical protein